MSKVIARGLITGVVLYGAHEYTRFSYRDSSRDVKNLGYTRTLLLSPVSIVRQNAVEYIDHTEKWYWRWKKAADCCPFHTPDKNE